MNTKPKIPRWALSISQKENHLELRDDAGGPWERLARTNQAFFDYCLHGAGRSSKAGHFEDALQWCAVAAGIASRKGNNGQLGSGSLESLLTIGAQQLPPAPCGHQRSLVPRWLHVMSEAYETLGHSNLCRRWIQYDSDGVTHDVVLTQQAGPVPKNLISVVRAANGQVVALDPAASLQERARQLRDYAWTRADVVLLHAHPDDVLPAVAFGVPGGPPVLLLNHADHVFWIGISVADMVVDIRSSGHEWTKQLRGVETAVTVPIPLAGTFAAESERVARRRALRELIGVPGDATMLLTVGQAYKYQPISGSSFYEAAEEIVSRCENCYLVAVGPSDEGEWRLLRQSTKGRVRAVGRQPDVTDFCLAADVYLEGFPVGSLTALLEAGETGIACVRSPVSSCPPFSSDGIAFCDLEQPLSVAAYIDEVVALVANSQARVASGRRIQSAIRAHHLGLGWLNHLALLKHQLPRRHSTYPERRQAPVPDTLRNWFLKFLYNGQPPSSPYKAVEPYLVELASRISSHGNLMTGELWQALQKIAPGGNMRGRFNKRILRKGIRRKWLQQGDAAYRNRQYRFARQFCLRCLIEVPSSIADRDWLKLALKILLGPEIIRFVRRRAN